MTCCKKHPFGMGSTASPEYCASRPRGVVTAALCCGGQLPASNLEAKCRGRVVMAGAWECKAPQMWTLTAFPFRVPVPDVRRYFAV